MAEVDDPGIRRIRRYENLFSGFTFRVDGLSNCRLPVTLYPFEGVCRDEAVRVRVVGPLRRRIFSGLIIVERVQTSGTRQVIGPISP